MSIPRRIKKGPNVIATDMIVAVFIWFINTPISNAIPVIIKEYPTIVPVKLELDAVPTVHRIIIQPATMNELYIVGNHSNAILYKITFFIFIFIFILKKISQTPSVLFLAFHSQNIFHFDSHLYFV